MRGIRHLRKPSPLRTGLSLLAGLLLTLFLTALLLWCQPNSFRQVLEIFRAQPLLILLNALPVGLTLLALGCLARNVLLGAAFTELIWGLLSLGNRIKIEVRDEPVFPRDLFLLKEVGSAMRNYHIRYNPLVIGVLAAVFLGLLLLGILFRREKGEKDSRSRGLLLRLGGFFGSLAVLTVLIFTVYSSKPLYQSFTLSTVFRPSTEFNESGFLYGFCRMFTSYGVDRPEGYSRREAERWDSAPGYSEDPAPVHVIMVMNEAFSDLTDAPVFQMEEDPMPNLHAIRQEAHTLYGNIVVPGFAGGTANTEFDVVTGIQTTSLSASGTSAMRVVNRNLDSLFRAFGDDGYYTSFLHPGTAWFYNRENVYRWMGADYTTFIGQMQDYETRGRFVSDRWLGGLIEREYANTRDAGRLLFNYTTTIQNHMSYTLDKYGEGYTFPHVETAVELSEEAQTLLDVYVEGVRDGDALLGQLREDFAAASDPIILVYFGDHKPYLGENGFVYRELGLDISQSEGDYVDSFYAYETPYVIWANDAAAEAVGWEQRVADLDLPQGGSISACFLGAAVLELTGRGHETAWTGFLNDLRRQLPVVQRYVSMKADGTIVRNADLAGTELEDLILKWRQWSYYKLKHKVIAD